ncbi:MAG: amidase family protein [Gemmatimonadaceae bacterium]|jgi:Asp-tRNA(Asn)/Glu-tRNA(Gln) amidotransferase A subunit family amidase|nr:amidase family protein [Gemmatimonadaceae bacterium]
MRPFVLAAASSLALAAPARAQSFDVMEATIPSVHAAMAAGRLTCRQLVQGYLDRIAAYDRQGPELHAIQTVNPRALAEADSLDGVWRAKAPRGPLHCVPVLLKDQVETKDMPTTYGSILFKDFVPSRDATVVQKLEAAGAIILAKTTMGEFAGRYVSSAAGIIRNAYDPTRNPSGSSSGSGAAAAANFGLVALGEDTGGSIRGPAAVHALVGLRPTLPLVSRFGMLPANPSQDTMGPMTRTVADAARVLDVIAGYDPRDPVTAYAVGEMPASYTTGLVPSALKGARIGVLRTRRSPAVRRSAPDSAAPRDTAALRRDSLARVDSVERAKVAPLFERALADLRALGATVIDSLTAPAVPLPRVGNDFETEAATDAYFAQHPTAPYKTLKEILLAGGVNPWRARALIEYVGRTPDEAGYGAVMRYREALRVAMLQLMADRQLDALVYATYDAPPALIARDVLTNPRPDDAYGRGDNRGLSPSLAWPALTVPMGFSADGLPAGLEFLGRPWSEPELFGYAFAFEQRTKHRRPPGTTPGLGR